MAEMKPSPSEEMNSSEDIQDVEFGKDNMSAVPANRTKPFIVLVACCAALG
jgi:hypothetical protein